ncbi:MAG: 50S ribosomal protein L21 [Patescibacteria group bacterium]
MDSKIAIIELGGKQHLVKEGVLIVVNKLVTPQGESLPLINILNGEAVVAKVVSHQLGKKIHGLKFKAKTRYLKRYGHRQSETTVEVVSIGGKPAAVAPAPSTKKPVSKKPEAKKTLVAKTKEVING